MADIVTIAGSPSEQSRSNAVLEYAQSILNLHRFSTQSIVVRNLPPQDLLHANWKSSAIQDSLAIVAQAQAVIIATPIYKAAYTGVLKVFLDLLPQNALANKVILPIATGGSPHHFSAVDYSLKPVLAALGAQHILHGVYITDNQISYTNTSKLLLEEGIEERLLNSLDELTTHLHKPQIEALAS
jgi:FMN reductase